MALLLPEVEVRFSYIKPMALEYPYTIPFSTLSNSAITGVREKKVLHGSLYMKANGTLQKEACSVFTLQIALTTPRNKRSQDLALQLLCMSSYCSTACLILNNFLPHALKGVSLPNHLQPRNQSGAC